MNKSLILRIITIITLINFIVIIILSIFISFIPVSNELLFKLVYSPIYFIPWLIIILLIVVYPWLIKSSLLKYLLIHFPIILLIFAVIITLVTTKIMSIQITEGQELNLQEICKKSGIKLKKNYRIKLNKFEIRKYDNNKKIVKLYKSNITIYENSLQNDNIIEINKPLKLSNIKIYQKDWSIAIREISFNFEQEQYNFFDIKDSLIRTQNGLYFQIAIYDIDNRKIIYKWRLFEDEDSVYKEGTFTSENPDDFLINNYKFNMINEDYAFTSILQINYKPAIIFLAMSSILLIISMFIKFWGINLFNNLVNIYKHDNN